jgi:integrase
MQATESIGAKAEVLQKTRFPKTDARYWRDKLFTRSTDEYQVQIGFAGKQERWPLHTANKEDACAKARDIYKSLVTSGHEATRARFKPWVADAESNREGKLTVGEYIEAARAVFTGKATTFTTYERKFRFLVAQLIGMKSDRHKFDPVKGYKAHRAKIDDTPLDEITPDKTQKWRVAYVQAAGNPLAQQRARVTVASIITNSKALFSPKKIIRHLRIALPSPLPFDGIERGKLPRARYSSKVNPATIARDAYAELKQKHPEQFKIFLLALGAGLRRAEIDSLTWKQFDFHNGTLEIAANEYGGTKTENSAEKIDLSPDVVAYFKAEMKKRQSDFVISSAVDPEAHAEHWNHYRGNGHFKALIKWLRGKGVKDRTPLHMLRKEFGSIINQKFGIFAASSALRHANITITRDHYVDRKERIALDMAELLDAKVITKGAA